MGGEENSTLSQFIWAAGGVNGNYEVLINDTEQNDQITREFVLDNSGPSISGFELEDGDRVNSDFGPISFDVSDEYSSISELDLEIDSEDWSEDVSDDCSDGSCSVEVDFPSDELESGTSYTLDITGEDSVGNRLSRDIGFVYDDEYTGDSDPEVSPSPQVFKGEGPGTFEVVLDGEDESEVRVVCQGDSWSEVDTTEWVDIEDGSSHQFECDYENSFDRALDLTVRMEDRAGNYEEKNIGDYYFDFSSPVLENLSAVVGVFNSDFQVSYDAHDTPSIEGLDVAKINYKIDDSTYDLQEGTNVSEVDGDFMVDTEGLSGGEHTVYAWAVDKAGRPSERRAFEFNFKPDAEPEVALGSVDSVSVTAGNSETVSVNVTNTGELFVGSMELSLNSDIRNSSRTLNDLKPGEMENGLFSVDTSSDDLGVHTLTFSTESPDSSRTVRFVVEANKDQEERIKSDYSEYISKYNELQENVTQLKNSGLSDSRKETLDSNTSEFFSDMESAKRAKESGDLYLVEKHMMDISADFQTASTAFDEVQKQHQRSERNQTFMMVFLLFIGLGGSGLAYIAFFSEQYELSMEALQDIDALEGPVQTVQTTLEQYELTLAPLENAVERVGELLAEEEKEIEEAEEQAFQGFT